MEIVLSVFSGIDLFGKGFESQGYCVVSSGDIITGQDIRDKHFPPNKFDGVIGGSPCQDFSKARRSLPTGNGLKMLSEFKRVIEESQPRWFVLENVPQVPDIEVMGYTVRRFNLNANECGSSQNRNRCFQYGCKDGSFLAVERLEKLESSEPCAMASEGKKTERRSFKDFCISQGLDGDFKLTEFHKKAKYKAVGNAVHLNVAKTIAFAVKNAQKYDECSTKFCACGCGRQVVGKIHKACATSSCRKRLQNNLNKSVSLPG